nr:hypothetical protein [Tanacetum cinerariifolium]GEW57510.1 hypothetical protein [Tanacetum cinerariifolium]
MPGPEHPPSPIEIPFVPEPEYPEYLAPSDDEAPLKDQPQPADASHIVASPDYPSNDDDDDTDDEDLEVKPFEEDDEEEEEHPASANSSGIPIGDLVLLAGKIEALEVDEPTHVPGSPISIPLSQTHFRRARMIIRPEPPMSASTKACIARHAALLLPPLFVPSLPLPLSSLLTTSLTDTGAPLGYKTAGIKMRALLPSTSRRTDIPEADMRPQKRACLTAPTLGFKNRESSTAGAARQPGPTESELRRCRVEQAGYGITDTWDEIVEKMMKIDSTTLEGVNERVTELDTIVNQRMDEFEVCFKDAQFDRALLRARVNTLFRDRPDHRRIAMLMDKEAIYSRKAWAFSMDRSSAIAAHKMAPKKRTTRATLATTTTPITTITNAQLQALIDRGVAATLAERAVYISRNDDNSNDSGTGGRRQMTTPRECSYTDFLNHRFQELALMCDRMFLEESAKVERYIGGLPDMVHSSIKASKPQSMQEAIEFATEMMDKKMLTHVERQAKHKRKFDDTSRSSHHQQQPFKRNNVA